MAKGLYNKYRVMHRETGVEVEGDCFVLRPDRDPAAVSALLRYADATRNESLAVDIWDWMQKIAPETVDNQPYEAYPLLGGSEVLVSPGDRVLAVRSRPDGIPITVDPDGIIDDVLQAYGAVLARLRISQSSAGGYMYSLKLNENGHIEARAGEAIFEITERDIARMDYVFTLTRQKEASTDDH